MECNNATPTLDLKVSNHYHASIQRNEKRKSKENCATCTTVTGEEIKGRREAFLAFSQPSSRLDCHHSPTFTWKMKSKQHSHTFLDKKLLKNYSLDRTTDNNYTPHTTLWESSCLCTCTCTCTCTLCTCTCQGSLTRWPPKATLMNIKYGILVGRISRLPLFTNPR